MSSTQNSLPELNPEVARPVDIGISIKYVIFEAVAQARLSCYSPQYLERNNP